MVNPTTRRLLSGRHGSFSRRAALGVMAGAPLALRSGRAGAQNLSGTISIGYDSTNTLTVPHIESTAEALQAANPDLHIELEPSTGSNYIIQLVFQLASGQAPDLFFLAGPILGELADAEYIIPLDDYLAEWDGWDQYPDSFKTAITFEGSVWSLPTSYDMRFLYYRRDIFQQAGLPVDWTPASPEEVLDAALAIKNAVPDVIPYALFAGANGGTDTVAHGFLPVVYAYGGEFRDENGLWIIDSCAIRAGLSYYERAYQIDQTVPQDVMTGASPVEAMRQAMLDGELGILYEGSWTYGNWLREDETTTREQIGYTLFPGSGDVPPSSVSGPGAAWYINATAEQPDLAWAFIEAFNTLETQVAVNVADPHIPGRQDAAAAAEFQDDPFLKAVVESVPSLVIEAPDPAFRQLITVVQNGTGQVATGEATPEEAIDHYASELTRILGEENVVRQPCP